MSSVIKPMMGVLIVEESTVTISSHSIKRPYGAYNLLKALGSADGESLKRLIGESDGLCSSSLLTVVGVVLTDVEFTSCFGGRYGCISLCTDSTSCGFCAAAEFGDCNGFP